MDSSVDQILTVRRAVAGELAEVGEMRVAAYLAGGHLPAESGYLLTLRRLGAAGEGDVLVAVGADGRLAGTVMLQRLPHAGQVVRAADEAEVRALAVAPGRERQGTGTALVRAVIELARTEDIRHLVLCTEPSMRAAHRLYARAGFIRLPDRDWSPVPGTTLLAYGLALPSRC